MKKLIIALMLIGTVGYSAARITNSDIASNAAIALSKLANSAGLSIVGRSANSSGALADITAANDGEVLRRSGTSIGFGDITFGALPQLTSYQVYGNATGSTADAASTSITSLLDGAFSSVQGSVLYRGASAWLALAPGSDGQVLTSGGAAANPAWEASAGGLTAASQAEMESASSTTVGVTPGVAKYHPGVAKAWVYYTEITTTAILGSYGVTSITDQGTGDTSINFSTAFSSANYACAGMAGDSGVSIGYVSDFSTRSTTEFRPRTVNTAGSSTDLARNNVVCFGDQ